MRFWRKVVRTAGHVRDLLTPGGEAGLIALEVETAAALVRAIDAAMPRGSTLWIDYPGDDAVELFLAERTRRGAQEAEPADRADAAGRSYRLTIRGDNLPMLARLVEGLPPRALGVHVGVDHDRRRLLSAFDLDGEPIEVGLSPRLSAEALRIFRAVGESEGRAEGRKDGRTEG